MKTKQGFNLRNVCGQDLIVAEGEENIDFSNIISMNESSAYLWTKLQQMDSFTVEDMAELILRVYDVDLDTAISDCETLAAQWAQIGIIEGDDVPKVSVTTINHVDMGDGNDDKKERSGYCQAPLILRPSVPQKIMVAACLLLFPVVC